MIYFTYHQNIKNRKKQTKEIELRSSLEPGKPLTPTRAGLLQQPPIFTTARQINHPHCET